MISFGFARFSRKLFLSAQWFIYTIAVTHDPLFTAGMTRYVSSANLTR